ncbi:MAG: hypothetical protein WAK40_08475 [Thermoplasmata archaeon]
MRVTKEMFDRAMASARSEADRIQYLGALLGQATGAEPIITGGSAIYLHAPSLEPSLDVDISVPREGAAQEVESWGFVRQKGRVWRREDLGMDVDLVGAFRGSRRRAKIIDTPYGPVRVACVEDMLIKRLAELKHWPMSEAWRTQVVKQVAVLLEDYGRELDEKYIAFLARRDDVIDILGDFRRNV